MHDVVVVGSGLFGSIIARHLRKLRLDVCVVDDARPDSGSRPAGCVIRPSWVSSMSKPDLRDGLRLLDDYYSVQEVVFGIGAGRTVTCSRVEPTGILQPPNFVASVSAIEMRTGYSALVFDSGPMITIAARRIVVAAGLWTPVLCPWVKTWGRWGWSFRGPAIDKPVIKLWAPYRQVVAFNMDDGLSWSGDGSALVLPSAEKPSALLAAASRCAAVVGDTLRTSTRGVRPYAHHPSVPCLISRRGDVWAVTGGAKNGTIAAAWAARRLQEEMRL